MHPGLITPFPVIPLRFAVHLLEASTEEGFAQARRFHLHRFNFFID